MNELEQNKKSGKRKRGHNDDGDNDDMEESMGVRKRVKGKFKGKKRKH